MKYASYSVITEDSHLMCRSQYSDPFGNCSDGARSLNKGKVCSDDSNCTSTDPNIKAACNCGWNVDGNSYCDLLPGDDEW